jgi:lipoyl(octanoyl) transferase
VTRPTGGRAVLHGDELTYSILAGKDEAPWCATLALSYEAIGAAWAQALEGFGLDMVRGATGDPLIMRASGSSPLQSAPTAPCFASSAKSELAFGGRKVVGSAQRRTRGAFVQHGSIPLTPDHERLIEVLPLDEAAKAAYLSTLRAHAISLGEITAVPEAFARAAWERGLAARLLTALGGVGVEGALTESEEAFARTREAELKAEQERFLGDGT